MRTGPVLVAAGLALLFVPLANAMGAFGYLLFGGGLLLAGSVLTFSPSLLGGSAGFPDRRNCPDCGAPNDLDATACTHCGTALP